MFIIISGISGAGKTTLINNVLRNSNKFAYPKCVTTRKKRETDNKERYIFVSKRIFEKYISDNSLLEYQLYKGNYYGTLKESYEKINLTGKIAISDIGFDGILSIKKNLKDVHNIFINIDIDLAVKHMIERGDNIKDIQIRLTNIDKEQQLLKSLADYCINNITTIEDLENDFRKILKEGRIL